MQRHGVKFERPTVQYGNWNVKNSFIRLWMDGRRYKIKCEDKFYIYKLFKKKFIFNEANEFLN